MRLSRSRSRGYASLEATSPRARFLRASLLALASALIVVILVVLQTSTLADPPEVPEVPPHPSGVNLPPEISHLSHPQALAALQTIKDQLQPYARTA